ncbi:RNA-directed DNA polymerase, eukaryota [Tanacetum coccineum]
MREKKRDNPDEIVVRRAYGKFDAFSKSDYKYLHKNDIKDLYLMCINGKVKDYRDSGLLGSLIVFIRSCVIWERDHDYQLGLESYQQKVNLTARTITFPGIERKKLLTFTSKPVVGLIYENSKKKKRVMIIKKIPKFCDVTLIRVLKLAEKMNKDVKHGYADPKLSDNDAEYLRFYEEYIKDRLRHRDQMRRWEMYVNGRPLLIRRDTQNNQFVQKAYEQFLAMSNQEAGGSGSGIKRTCAYILREREEAEQRLLDDYFGDDETPPKYPEENFRRRYRMSSTLFAKIVNDITSYDAEPLPEYFRFFRQRYDATGRASIDPILKCTSAIRHLAYGTSPDAFDEYLQIVERCSRECLDNFTKCIYIIDCGFGMHILGFRANNDLNVLYGSPLFDDFLSDTAPEAPFVVNGRTYKKGYYLPDGAEMTLNPELVGALQGLEDYTTTGTTLADVAALFSAMAQAMARRYSML